MELVSGDPVTAARRFRWSVLRPALLLGGFVAVWWALMTGTAQADSTPRHDVVDQLRSQLHTHQHQIQHQRPGHGLAHATQRAHADVKATSAPVRHQVRDAVRPVAKSVRRHVSATADRTPLAPAVAKATTAVHGALSETVKTGRGVLEQSPVGPVVEGAEGNLGHTAENAESAPAQGNSPKPRYSSKASLTALSGQPHVSPGVQPEPSAAPDRTAGSVHRDAPADWPRTPAPPDPCSSLSGSGSSSSEPVGIASSSLLMRSTVQEGLGAWRIVRPPGGPAYQPGCSPD